MQLHRLSEELRPLLKFYAVHPKVRQLHLRCSCMQGSGDDKMLTWHHQESQNCVC